MHLIGIIIIGGIAGWLAGKIIRGDGFGIIIDIIVGIIGGWIGGSVLGWFGVRGGGIIGDLIIAIIGAIILIWIIRLIRKVA
ncbi:MAG: GlsB/YeaQ/YmgE family stress response membrane protein [Chitinophagaceae bacterium]